MYREVWLYREKRVVWDYVFLMAVLNSYKHFTEVLMRIRMPRH
jgi:hypothetical protein